MYFGRSNSSGILWRVLDAESGLLLANSVFTDHRYDDNSFSDWENSELNAWLNGNEYKRNTNLFMPRETSRISESGMTLLTYDDMMNTEYGFPNVTYQCSLRSPGSNRSAWLRCVGTYNDRGDFIFQNGSLGTIISKQCLCMILV